MKQITQLPRLFFLLNLIPFLSGCSDSRIDGYVQNGIGEPLSGVAVTIEKSRFDANTDSEGRYSIDYAPGPIRLSFTKDGYATEVLDLNIQEKVRYPAKTINLFSYNDNKSPQKLSKSIIHSLRNEAHESFNFIAFPPKEIARQYVESLSPESFSEQRIAEFDMNYKRWKTITLSGWAEVHETAEHIGLDWEAVAYKDVEISPARHSKKDVRMKIMFASNKKDYAISTKATPIGDNWYLSDTLSLNYD